MSRDLFWVQPRKKRKQRGVDQGGASAVIFAALLVIFLIPVAKLYSAGAAEKTDGTALVKIEDSAGRPIAFTVKGTPTLEVVNDRLVLSVSSREGMIFELTEIPAKVEIVARSYQGSEFRTLLLHTPFQEEAATDDSLEQDSRLQIRKVAGKAGGEKKTNVESAEIHFSGKLRAGAEVLHVRFQFSGRLPVNRRFVTSDQ